MKSMNVIAFALVAPTADRLQEIASTDTAAFVKNAILKSVPVFIR
jgi:hypothetical protein